MKHLSNGLNTTAKQLMVSLVFLLTSISYANSGITYHGRILKPDNTPVDSVTTQFRIQIRTLNSCLLWEERFQKDLSNTNGTFTITINSSDSRIASNAVVNPNTSSTFSLDDVFSNRRNFTGLTECSVGSTYNPNPSDGRVLTAYFRESISGSWEEMPESKINYVPFSLQALQLEGLSSSDFLKINPAASQTPLTVGQVNTLLDIIAGTNSQYVQDNSAFGGDVSGTFDNLSVNRIRGVNVTATTPTTGQVLKFDGTNWIPDADNAGSSGDASYSAKGVVQINADQATSGLYISSGVLALPNLIMAGGPTGTTSLIPVITWDQKGRLTAVTTATVDDTSKLPLSGGTMTGPIDMDGRNIVDAGNLNATLVTATNVSATGGSFRSVILNDTTGPLPFTITLQAPSILSSNYVLQLPADDGDPGDVLTSNGSGVLSWGPAASAGISSLNSQTGSSQSLAPAATATSYGFTSATNTHTLSIPAASTASVAAGTISNTEYLSFVGKLTSPLATKGDILVHNGTNHVALPVGGNGLVLIANSATASGLEWAAAAAGDITEVVAGNGLTGGATTGSASLAVGAGTGIIVNANDVAVDVGTGNNQIVQLDGTAKLPAVDGSQLTNLNLGNIGSGTLAIARGGTNSTTALTNNKVMISSGGAIVEGNAWNTANSNNTFVMRDGSGNISGAAGNFSLLDILGTATPAVSASGSGRIYFDSTSNTFKVSQHGAGYTDLVPSGGAVGGSGATNSIPRFTGTSTLGNSALSDDGTTITATRSIATVTNTVSAAAVNLATSNTHTLATVGGSVITITNPSNGGVYNIVVEDTTSRTYTFSGCTNSYFKPANAATVNGTRTVYGLMTIQKGGNWDCYITWSSGFQ